ncbi:Protein kinase, catalytic domain-containing protein [Cynara cardunculus var. scolymus]|uniref:Protein kinase, catalytic domain-containing protein n=1 Tax=Cynara cardunculus var. scolymus TaxID=59895 RepID=A0A118JRE9_CYNCS|nr:Protein kinase, catalytic domain-containing protein [Cynara cardunculus var. scolymus]
MILEGCEKETSPQKYDSSLGFRVILFEETLIPCSKRFRLILFEETLSIHHSGFNPSLSLSRESGGEVYFTMPRLQSITIQCLEALQFLHGLGLIHCDLKPENILVKSYSRCEVKVIDLGSSCFETYHLCSYVQSRSYRAPEVILGLPYDKKNDIWSLGCILAKLCTGNPNAGHTGDTWNMILFSFGSMLECISSPCEDDDSEEKLDSGEKFDATEVSSKEISGDYLSASKDHDLVMAPEEDSDSFES